MSMIASALEERDYFRRVLLKLLSCLAPDTTEPSGAGIEGACGDRYAGPFAGGM
jgi:hypothetical protein